MTDYFREGAHKAWAQHGHFDSARLTKIALRWPTLTRRRYDPYKIWLIHHDEESSDRRISFDGRIDQEVVRLDHFAEFRKGNEVMERARATG